MRFSISLKALGPFLIGNGGQLLTRIVKVADCSFHPQPGASRRLIKA